MFRQLKEKNKNLLRLMLKSALKIEQISALKKKKMSCTHGFFLYQANPGLLFLLKVRSCVLF
jgi:hypothetical protein